MRCPCRKKSEARSYGECCGPLHAGLKSAATAEALMRSRYSAFASKNAEYLLATWHPTTRPETLAFAPDDPWEWVQLRIIAAAEQGDEATVEFVARRRSGGQSRSLHEVSRFGREAGRWLYVDGLVA